MNTRDAASRITLELLAPEDLWLAQGIVEREHYLHRPVDQRCSPVAYAVLHDGTLWAGVLIFGRPEATRCRDWYGSVEDVQDGRCEVTRWQVINLARVYFSPWVQPGGFFYGPDHLPGFTDRRGVFRSALASTAVKMALDRIAVDYLKAKPLCFPDEPYELGYCMSYCDTRLHRGVLYQVSGFEQYETGNPHIQTWRKRLRGLTPMEERIVLDASDVDPRARRYRGQRMQLALGI